MSIDPAQAERGRRIKMLRAMLGKNQQEFAKICGVSAISINLWEKGAYSGLSKKGTQKIIQCLTKENISCSAAWLWEGIGNPPTKSTSLLYSTTLSSPPFDQIQAITQETQLFLQHFPQGVIMEISDDSMQAYRPGDYVGGVWLKEIPKVFNDEALIVRLQDGTILLRQIAYDETKKQFFLYATHTKSTAPHLYLADAKIDRCAKIIRLWKIFVDKEIEHADRE